MRPDPTHARDKLALFVIVGVLAVSLAGIAYGLITHAVPVGSVGIIGTIVGIIGSRIGEIIKVIQTSWEAVQWGKMTDKLGSSTPSGDPSKPQSVKVVNEPEDPVPTTDSGETEQHRD